MKTQTSRKAKPIRLFLVGGGSGGHITPVLALAKEIKKQQPAWQLTYAGAGNDPIGQRLVRGQAQLFSGVHFLPAGKFRRFGRGSWPLAGRIWSLLLNCRDIILVLAGVVASLYLLRRARPDLVFSKGGYPALGPCLAARILRIPLVVHDSDAVPGLTHRIVGRWARLRLTGLPVLTPRPRERYVGVPVASRLAEPLGQDDRRRLLAGYKIDPADRLVLVFGGGLGAVNLNRVLVETLDSLKLPPRVHFILVAGGANYQAAVKSAADLKRRDQLTLLGFVDNLADLIRAAEIVVTRAGATALSEVTVAAKPTIIIPKPFMPGNHQVHNANIYRRAAAAVVVADNGRRVNRRAFAGELESLLASSVRRRQLEESISQLAKTAATSQTLESIREVLARQLRAKSPPGRDWTRHYLRYRNLAVRQPAASPAAWSRQWHLGAWLALILAALVLVRLLYIGQIKVAVRSEADSVLIGPGQIASLERELAVDLAPDLKPYPNTSDWLNRRFRPRFDLIQRQLLERYPYLDSVRVRRDWWLSEVTLVVEAQPVIGVARFGRQAAVLMANGFVVGGYPEIVTDPELTTVWVDFDLNQVAWRRPILSSNEISFIQQVGGYLRDQDYRVRGFRLTPNPQEFVVELEGYDFGIVTTTLVDPVLQAAAADLTIQHFEAADDPRLPREHLDVRLVDRVVYK